MILVIKNIKIEGPGMIESFFASRGYIIKTVELGEGEKLPENLLGINAVFIMGGPMNVYETEKYGFLSEEGYFITEAVRAGLPVMGICLGAQLMAKAFGAKVSKAAEKEIGWHKISLSAAGETDPLFNGLGRELEVFQWHGDKFEVPEGGVLLGSSPVCGQAFRLGKKAYALQFHIEVTSEIINCWLKDTAETTKEKAAAIEKDTGRLFEGYKDRADKIFLNFLDIMNS
ncbi:MAG TPA: GMP synthase [Elusimicrobia bacterium]|nr:MAG: hypothetical protein A2278_06590 [Elusimicrobia bacterium RIFOXYA12_FULL_49_49]OGS16285.1 MAG: hypothetical protein A2251_01595 [Elusimicrobia bacterium RIFOXYA2_FULL_47_53]OGS26173.1 MAG: hypothetical protein A2339_02500 [Elusimicrobia bacterium RIFOXYB12_FULL_50_12]OGS31440.1 MAG: hypothetical protein A2323_09885 [Elusimicrobia bacterium RIFOXYB2_FULL_46_23]HBU70509.1 GMP synthase [Elusimicrobiota bacterium]